MEFLQTVRRVIDAWEEFGNQEIYWFSNILYPEAPVEFLEYEESCKVNCSVENLLDAEIGVELLQNYVEAMENGIDPLMGWRFRLHSKLCKLSDERRVGSMPFIWDNIAKPLYKQTIEECQAFLQQFCVCGEWKQDYNGAWYCEIQY